jgi:hypothetical protein
MSILLRLQTPGEIFYPKIAIEKDWLWQPIFLNLQADEFYGQTMRFDLFFLIRTQFNWKLCGLTAYP